jgi:hypothetical protein
MSLIDLLPELKQRFDSDCISASSLTDDLERRIEQFLTDTVGNSMAGPLHTVTRELIQNAIKANLKRLVFYQNQINPMRPGDYGRGMEQFHRSLSEYDRSHFASEFQREDIRFEVIFSFHPRVSVLHITNPGRLFRQEDERIRQKFRASHKVESLYQFYLNYSDLAEGSGMGIALAFILIKQLGLDPRLLSIYSEERLDLTVSRLILPRSPDYRTPRQRFEILLEKLQMDRQSLREHLRLHTEGIPFLDDEESSASC